MIYLRVWGLTLARAQAFFVCYFLVSRRLLNLQNLNSNLHIRLPPSALKEINKKEKEKHTGKKQNDLSQT